MSTLLSHIKNQHDRATTLAGIMLAIDLLNNEGLAEGDAHISLLRVAREITEQIVNGLDSVNLPKEGRA